MAREIDLLRGFVLGLTLFSPTLLGGVTLFVRQVCRRIVGAMGRVWQPCLRPRRRFICSVLPPSGVFMGGGCSCWDSMLIGNARSSGLPCPCNVWGCCFDGGRMGGVSSFGRRRCPAIVVVDFSPRLSKLPRPPDTGFRAAQRWGRCSLIRHNRGGRPTPSSRPGGVVEAASSHGRSAIAMVPLVHRGARSRILYNPLLGDRPRVRYS